jgi:hypothetical protein
LVSRAVALLVAGLAGPYTSDPRYTASYDEIEPGFSQYVHDAIMANADRAQQ